MQYYSKIVRYQYVDFSFAHKNPRLWKMRTSVNAPTYADDISSCIWNLVEYS